MIRQTSMIVNCNYASAVPLLDSDNEGLHGPLYNNYYTSTSTTYGGILDLIPDVKECPKFSMLQHFYIEMNAQECRNITAIYMHAWLMPILIYFYSNSMAHWVCIYTVKIRVLQLYPKGSSDMFLFYTPWGINKIPCRVLAQYPLKYHQNTAWGVTGRLYGMQHTPPHTHNFYYY